MSAEDEEKARSVGDPLYVEEFLAQKNQLVCCCIFGLNRRYMKKAATSSTLSSKNS